MRIRIRAIMVALLCTSELSLTQHSSADDSITTSQQIRYGETIISTGTFELGFFRPGDPSKRYVGIWYKKVTTVMVAWIANRLTPVTDGKGILRVTDQGELILENGTGGIVWSSNTSVAGYNPIARLLDSGNLVVRNGINGDFLWQSFDYPTGTLLAGMKHGKNKTSGFDRYLKSWRSVDDPSPGPWNGVRWSGTPYLDPNMYYYYELVLTDEEAYYHYKLQNTSVITRLYLSPTGNLQRFTWIDKRKSWLLYLNAPMDNCDSYSLCGPHGTCTITDSQVCACLKGFIPKSPQEWDVTNWSQGCIRRTALGCGTDIFVKYGGVKLPNTHYSWFNRTMNLEDCRNTCKNNCSCMAYSNLDIRDGGSGCLQWYGDLVDIRTFNERGQEIYVRMSAAESGLLASSRKKHKLLHRELIVGLAAAIAGICLFLYFLKKKISKKTCPTTGTAHRFQLEQSIEGEEDLELPLFGISKVLTATENFSSDNKLGEGGFGPVYKGVLSNGQEVAVKKLSPSSRQGLDELKNEVIYIAKLQHRNLVKLLGCCIQEDNLLIYEYMPNGSLDSFLFNPMRRKLLDWKKRLDIIAGIARGLVYLHHDSRIRIIHRDLKASNILLDEDMNPKISDFGLARSFIGNETTANTNRVVGTYYMSPEYAIDGAFSTKSDVFSYGVLVLEIVSGKRNRGFYHPDHQHNLLGHAWKLFVQEGNPLELLDPGIEDSYDAPEILRCIQIGLLCVQQCPEDRPSMSKVVMMFESEIELQSPKEPGFFNERKPCQSHNNTSSSQQPCSSNGISATFISPR